MRTSFLALPALFLAAAAHEEHKTPDEIAKFKALQESAYHCAPVIAAQLDARKRSAQQALGIAENTEAAAKFLNAFEHAQDTGAPILGCSPLEEARIRNHTCVLAPEVTQGPYYHEAGHPIRQNIAEDQLGLPFMIDIGVIDVKTCQPVEGVLVDIWHANTTGHYAGHADPDPDLKWEGPAPYGVRKGLLTKFPRWKHLWEETFLKGAWPTNKHGVSQFASIFPGYYTGRATHVHVKIHTEWTPVPENNTFVTGHIIHTGQLFVDDRLNGVIDKIHPYTTNPIADKWGRTRNWDDSLQIYQASHANGYGPTFEIEKIGGVLQQGLIGYITIGVDLEADYDRTYTNQVPYTRHTPTEEEAKRDKVHPTVHSEL